MPSKRYAGIHYDVVYEGRNVGFVEIRGYIKGANYCKSEFEGLTHEEVLDKIRKDYRDNPRRFMKYNQSSGYFMK